MPIWLTMVVLSRMASRAAGGADDKGCLLRQGLGQCQFQIPLYRATVGEGLSAAQIIGAGIG